MKSVRYIYNSYFSKIYFDTYCVVIRFIQERTGADKVLQVIDMYAEAMVTSLGNDTERTLTKKNMGTNAWSSKKMLKNYIIKIMAYQCNI